MDAYPGLVQEAAGGVSRESHAREMSPRRSVEELLESVGDVPLRLVYIAGNLTDAHEVERVLDERQIVFAVSLEAYTKAFSLALGGQYQGAFFYVPDFQHQHARELLQSHGMPDIVE